MPMPSPTARMRPAGPAEVELPPLPACGRLHDYMGELSRKLAEAAHGCVIPSPPKWWPKHRPLVKAVIAPPPGTPG